MAAAPSAPPAAPPSGSTVPGTGGGSPLAAAAPPPGGQPQLPGLPSALPPEGGAPPAAGSAPPEAMPEPPPQQPPGMLEQLFPKAPAPGMGNPASKPSGVPGQAPGMMDKVLNWAPDALGLDSQEMHPVLKGIMSIGGPALLLMLLTKLFGGRGKEASLSDYTLEEQAKAQALLVKQSVQDTPASSLLGLSPPVKRAGLYGHFIHTAGLTPEQRKAFDTIARQVTDFRQGVYKAQAGSGYSAHAGGSTNMRDDIIENFMEANPEAQVWPGSTVQIRGKKGPRRWLGLLPGKEQPPGEGYATMVAHQLPTPADFPENPEDADDKTMEDLWNRYTESDAYTDFYGDVDPSVHESLRDWTRGRYQWPGQAAAPDAATQAPPTPAPDLAKQADLTSDASAGIDKMLESLGYAKQPPAADGHKQLLQALGLLGGSTALGAGFGALRKPGGSRARGAVIGGTAGLAGGSGLLGINAFMNSPHMQNVKGTSWQAPTVLGATAGATAGGVGVGRRLASLLGLQGHKNNNPHNDLEELDLTRKFNITPFG